MCQGNEHNLTGFRAPPFPRHRHQTPRDYHPPDRQLGQQNKPHEPTKTTAPTLHTAVRGPQRHVVPATTPSSIHPIVSRDHHPLLVCCERHRPRRQTKNTRTTIGQLSAAGAATAATFPFLNAPSAPIHPYMRCYSSTCRVNPLMGAPAALTEAGGNAEPGNKRYRGEPKTTATTTHTSGSSPARCRLPPPPKPNPFFSGLLTLSASTDYPALALRPRHLSPWG